MTIRRFSYADHVSFGRRRERVVEEEHEPEHIPRVREQRIDNDKVFYGILALGLIVSFLIDASTKKIY